MTDFTNDSPSQNPPKIAVLFQQYSRDWDIISADRHIEKVIDEGIFEFLTNDVIEDMIAHLADISNAAKSQYLKLRLLQEVLSDKLPADSEGELTMGLDSFKDVQL